MKDTTVLKIKFFQRPEHYPVTAYWLAGNVLCIPLKIPKSEAGLDLNALEGMKQKLLTLLSKQDRSGKTPYIIKEKCVACTGCCT